jgi:cytoskeletal protein RodZ
MTDHVSEEEVAKGFDEYHISLGDRMRGERATLGKTLEDIKDDIKLRVDILEGIENADLSAFPSPSFVAGYVRSYATHLGLDAQKCFEQFCEESGFVGLQAEIDGTKVTTRKKRIAKGSVLLDDPILNPRVPNMPAKSGFLSNISPSAILSLVILLGLVAGLAYGGMAVLKEVQRVQFAPINETPSVVRSVSIFGETDTPLSDDETQIQVAELEAFYRPTELSVPRLTPRDGPISGIDPSSFGVFAQPAQPQVITIAKPIQPQVTEEGPETVDVVALKPAWVRVYMPEGGILFEKILDTGQRYRLPEGVNTALMRAGNSGSVYVMIGEKMYGPVGKATGVARKVALDASTIPETYAFIEEGFDQPLSEPINTDLTAQAVQ